jgi:hypothetical protein
LFHASRSKGYLFGLSYIIVLYYKSELDGKDKDTEVLEELIRQFQEIEDELSGKFPFQLFHFLSFIFIDLFILIILLAIYFLNEFLLFINFHQAYFYHPIKNLNFKFKIHT